MDLSTVIKAPLVTEKANLLKEAKNQVAFKVDLNADKASVKRAVETFFKVKVLDVRTAICRGKYKRHGKTIGKRPNWKKAIVSLSEGQKIEFFEGV